MNSFLSKSVFICVHLWLIPLGAGCGGSPALAPGNPSTEPAAPTITVVKPERKTVQRTIEQPGQISAFEQAPLHVKIAGYVRKVHVDIGDEVNEGDVLAELWVPEMEEELKQKQAMIAQAKAEVGQMAAAREAAEANVKTMAAAVREAAAGRRRALANYDRWQSELQRVEKLVAGKVIDEQTRDEVRNQFRAAEAAREEVEAKVHSAEAAGDESKARLDRARADVAAAEARLLVAEADCRQCEAELQYTKVRAPFTGAVTLRHVDTGHFLQPPSGTRSDPLFVIIRTNPVRVFVDVPETDAPLVKKDLPARVRVQALKGREFVGKVTRTARALDPKTRTLRTEIDLPNTDGELLPEMYAYAVISSARPDVLALPASAIVTQGDQTFCFRVEDGKAIRTPIQIGLSGGGLVEVLKKQTQPPKPGEPPTWEDFTGSEAIISTNAGSLADGQAVTVGTHP